MITILVFFLQSCLSLSVPNIMEGFCVLVAELFLVSWFSYLSSLVKRSQIQEVKPTVIMVWNKYVSLPDLCYSSFTNHLFRCDGRNHEAFPPFHPSWVPLKKFMFSLFRILRCANTTEYCPRWATFAQRIYSLSVVMMARHTIIPACSVMKTCKYAKYIISSRVEIYDTVDPQ